MYFLLKMVIFHCYILIYKRVSGERSPNELTPPPFERVGDQMSGVILNLGPKIDLYREKCYFFWLGRGLNIEPVHDVS